MKKILTMLPGLALALLLAMPAMAFPYFPMPSHDELNVSSSNGAMVTNEVSATSDTGSNHTMFNGGSFSGNIATGPAYSGATSGLAVNSNSTGVSAPCNCYDDVTVKSSNHAYVTNLVGAGSYTGGNGTMGNGGFFGGGSGNIATGAAASGATSWTAVNSNMTWIH